MKILKLLWCFFISILFLKMLFASGLSTSGKAEVTIDDEKTGTKIKLGLEAKNDFAKATFYYDWNSSEYEKLLLTNMYFGIVPLPVGRKVKFSINAALGSLGYGGIVKRLQNPIPSVSSSALPSSNVSQTGIFFYAPTLTTAEQPLSVFISAHLDFPLSKVLSSFYFESSLLYIAPELFKSGIIINNEDSDNNGIKKQQENSSDRMQWGTAGLETEIGFTFPPKSEEPIFSMKYCASYFNVPISASFDSTKAADMSWFIKSPFFETVRCGYLIQEVAIKWKSLNTLVSYGISEPPFFEKRRYFRNETAFSFWQELLNFNCKFFLCDALWFVPKTESEAKENLIPFMIEVKPVLKIPHNSSNLADVQLGVFASAMSKCTSGILNKQYSSSQYGAAITLERKTLTVKTSLSIKKEIEDGLVRQDGFLSKEICRKLCYENIFSPDKAVPFVSIKYVFLLPENIKLNIEGRVNVDLKKEENIFEKSNTSCFAKAGIAIPKIGSYIKSFLFSTETGWSYSNDEPKNWTVKVNTSCRTGKLKHNLSFKFSLPTTKKTNGVLEYSFSL